MEPPLLPRAVEGLHGQSWMAEVEVAHLIYLASFKPRILEIGTASGVTAACVAQSNPNASLICVDTFVSDREEYDQERKRNWERNREDNMLLVIADSGTLHEHLPPSIYKFDLIIIDGDHSYESCLRDLRVVVPYCEAHNTSIVCHDYGDYNHHAVARAVHHFLDTTDNKFRFVNIQHSLVELLNWR